MTTITTLDGGAGLTSACAAGMWLVAGNRVSSPTRVA
jgi:beta-phosphoglucomutase-like phosphatase (HAD superfamily)